MNNGTNNLIPIVDGERAKELGRKGGIESGKARRRKKLFKEYLDNKLEETRAGENISNKEYIAKRLVKILISEETSDNNFFKALDIARDILGEKNEENAEKLKAEAEYQRAKTATLQVSGEMDIEDLSSLAEMLKA